MNEETIDDVHGAALAEDAARDSQEQIANIPDDIVASALKRRLNRMGEEKLGGGDWLVKMEFCTLLLGDLLILENPVIRENLASITSQIDAVLEARLAPGAEITDSHIADVAHDITRILRQTVTDSVASPTPKQ